MIELFKDIPGSEHWKNIHFVDKGWSDDKKYHIVTNAGEHLLLRISAIETYEFKKKEFAVIKKLSSLDFEMSKEHEVGVCGAGVYMLLDWIEGLDLEEVLMDMSLLEQYKLGYEAGTILKKIQETDVEFEQFSWEKKFNNKIDRKIKMYEECTFKYERGDLFIDYLNNSRHLLKNRPLVLQHGDYHVGNMIFSKSGHIGIIDFNRFDVGDPWEEFNRIVWDTQNSHAFATGRVDGYFDGNIPEDFFELLAVYIASNILSSLPWAIPFGNKEIEIMKKLAEDVLNDVDDFKCIIPKWYSETKKNLALENYKGG